MEPVLAPNKSAILGFSLGKLHDFLLGLDEKPFRAVQLIKWLHQLQVDNFDLMLNLSKNLRTKLKTHAQIELPKIVADQTASDGTRKWLLELKDQNYIEAVYIPTLSRDTLCISSQVGCSLNCSFCYTAQQGFNRNLSSAEIIGQLLLANKFLKAENKKITNIVIMGMGEPLLNFNDIVQSLKLMLDDNAYGLSKRKVTLSTSGVVPQIYKLQQEVDVSLAVSLHATNNLLRDQLVPINKKYPLNQLMLACKDYLKNTNRKNHITFEYVMLKGINDSLLDANNLVKLVQGITCKINLIPFNPFPNTSYLPSEKTTIVKFQTELMSAGLNTIIRRTRGDDITAACGQLAGKIKDRTRRSQKILQTT